MNSARLGSPVSASWVALWRSCAIAATRFADVAPAGQQVRDAALAVEQRPDRLLLVVELAVAAAVDQHAAELAAGAHGGPQLAVEIGLLRSGLEQRGRAAEHLLPRPAGERLEGGVDVLDAALRSVSIVASVDRSISQAMCRAGAWTCGNSDIACREVRARDVDHQRARRAMAFDQRARRRPRCDGGSCRSSAARARRAARRGRHRRRSGRPACGG